MNTVRIVVIGAGLIGEKHARLISASEKCSLAGICDINPDRKSVAEKLNVPFYRDIEEMLESEQPDGAIIATPNGFHRDCAQTCARRSVHILIEKPIADTLSAAHRIIETADQHGIRVLVGHHRRHNPLTQKTRSLIQEGAIGKLVGVSVLWTLLKPPEYYTSDWRCERPGGGPTLINLIHEIDSLRFICGEIRRVYAQSSSAARKLDVEDSISATLSFENGALGSVLASDATPAPWSYETTSRENPYYAHADEDCYRFLGTEGALTFPGMELWRYPDRTQIGWQNPLAKSHFEVAAADPLVSQLEHFRRVISREQEPLIDGRDGAQTLAVALAVLESAQRGSPINIPPL